MFLFLMGYECFFLVDMNGIFMAHPIQKSHEKNHFYIHDIQFTLYRGDYPLVN